MRQRRAQELRIAIDGPSGAGKSTLARALAERLGSRYVDTGAMYRALGWKAIRDGLSDEEVVAGLPELELRIVADPTDFRVQVDGVDVTAELRTPEVARRASEVAQLPEVREWLVERQRAEAAAGAVMEGRDIGTVVLVDADLKLFVTAPEAVRMERRAAQLGERMGERITADIRDRDRRDRGRKTSPLQSAPEALEIDTGDDSPEASLARILEVVRRRFGIQPAN